MRALDQSGYVGDHESTKVTEIYYTEMRLQCRERVIGNLRTRGRDSRDKCRLSRIRKTNQTNIREQLQLELKVQLFTLASGLMVARGAIRRGCKVRVSKTAAAAACSQPAIAVVTQVVQQITRRSIKDLCSDWNANNQVFTSATGAIGSLAMQATRRNVARVVAQVQQRVERIIRHKDHVAAAATVST